MKSIPVNTPLITESDIEAVAASLREGWVSGDGPIVAKFEADFAQFCGRKHGISVTNGTAAIELVIHALNFGPNDEIIVPSFAIISCISQILRCGATPVFVDSDPITWNMDTSKLEESITAKTKAILVVHTYGLPVEMDTVLGIAQKHGLIVIEDAAESHGLTYNGKRCGSFGLVSTFSFYANKNIMTGEGGMIVTDDDLLNEKLRYFRNLTFQQEHRFVHNDLGWNLRMSSVQCALGSSQLSRINEITEQRRRVGSYYHSAFAQIEDIQIPFVGDKSALNDYWVFGIVLNGRWLNNRSLIQNTLSELGIGTRPFFWPLHLQPVLKQFGLTSNIKMKVSEYIGQNGFYIPNGLGMKELDIEYVAEQVQKVLT